MHIFNSTFDRIVCINLPERTDRKSYITKLFKGESIRFEFVDGLRIQPETRSDNMLTGYYGLNQAIINILQDCIKNNIDSVMIFEDDVAFSDDYLDIFTEDISHLPKDWGVLYLGCYNKLAPILVSGRLYKVKRALLGHAVAIRSSLFPKIIELLTKMDMPSDVCICEAYREEGIKAYSFLNKGIAHQIRGYSDNCRTLADNRRVS